jgi:DNA-binding XRE family transcriptional regulator
MGGEGAGWSESGAESKRDEYEAEAGPLWGEEGPHAGPALGRGGAEAESEAESEAGPSLGLDEAGAEPGYTPVFEPGYAATLRELKALRESFDAAQDAPEDERVGAPGPRRRARRWGEAARKAARNEVADGERRPRRSLKAVREGFPLSQRELSDRTNLSRSTIGALESRRRRPQPATMRVIARVLGVEAGEIAWW